jgi:hypothetical protein
MRLKLFQPAIVLTAILICLNCGQRTKVSDAKAELLFQGDKSKLSANVFENLDYQVKSFGEDPPDDWHKQNFQTLWTRDYQVKRQTSLKEQSNTFPRYTVVEEVYETEELAAVRFKRIQDKPPGLPVEQREYWIVTGFQYGKNVYFIQTDSVLFSYYMEDFAEKLAAEINKKFKN